MCGPHAGQWHCAGTLQKGSCKCSKQDQAASQSSKTAGPELDSVHTVSFMAGAHICLHLLIAQDVANVLLDNSGCPLGIAADLPQKQEGQL